MFRARAAFNRDEKVVKCTLDMPDALLPAGKPDDFPLMVLQTDSTTVVLLANDKDRSLSTLDIALLMDAWITAMTSRFGMDTVEQAMLLVQSGVLESLNPNDN